MTNETLPKPPSAAKKYWAGYAPHPFLAFLHELLRARKFAFSGYHQDGQFLTWNRPLFPGYSAQVWVTPSNTNKKTPDIFGVMIFLAVTSSRQAEIENTLRINECSKIRGDFFAQPAESNVTVLNVNLGWLVQYWPPRAYNFDDGYYRWARLSTSESKDAAADVVAFFDRYGENFFCLVDSPIKLSSVLLDLQNFPGIEFCKNADSAPVSSSQEEYASVLFHDSGQKLEAINALSGSLKKIETQVARGFRDALEIEIQKCRIERYLSWMKNSGVPSVE